MTCAAVTSLTTGARARVDTAEHASTKTATDKARRANPHPGLNRTHRSMALCLFAIMLM